MFQTTLHHASPTADAPKPGRAVFWLALLTAGATFPLIFMGGLVTSHQAGMTVPDWPNSFGYNMFLFPPGKWVGGIFYEHVHRLMGSAVGFLALTLAIWSWRARILAPLVRRLTDSQWRPPTEPHRLLALVVLAGVIFQGVLGGLRVVLVKLDLAIVHACVAQAFFCLAAYAALVNSPSWNAVRDFTDSSSGRRLALLGVFTVAVIYLQLILGATMRHYQAGLAIPDLPLAYGKLLPPTSSQSLDAINAYRLDSLDLAPVTLWQIWLHFAHRVGAIAVLICVSTFAHKAYYRADAPGLSSLAIGLMALLGAQITLGVLTVMLKKPADVASAHVAIGAALLVSTFLLTARCWRRYGTTGRARWPAHGSPAATSLPIERENQLVPG